MKHSTLSSSPNSGNTLVGGSGSTEYLPHFTHEGIFYTVLEMHIYIDWGGRAMDIVAQFEEKREDGKTLYPQKTFTIYGRKDKQHLQTLDMSQKFCKWVMDGFKMFDTNGEV